VCAKHFRCSSYSMEVMNTFRNLNADSISRIQGEHFGVHGKVLSQCMCVPNIKGVAKLVWEL